MSVKSATFSNLLARLAALWRRWPRRLVLAGAGTPVDLLHVEEKDGTRRVRVRLPDGRELDLPPEALASRPVFAPVYAVLSLALIVVTLFGLADRDPTLLLQMLERLVDLLLPAAAG